MSSFNVDPFDLSIVSQKDCPKSSNGDHGVNINIDDDTFSAKSIAGVIRKAGEKIGDGVEYLANGAKKVYHDVADSKGSGEKEQVTQRARYVTPNPSAEWLP